MSNGNCGSNSLRSPWKRRKNLVLGFAFLLIGCYVWVQYVEMNAAFTPLRPLVDAESEARRLLTLMTHYNYQCNVTLTQVGNATQWPLCVIRETGFNSDVRKISYTVGTLPDYSLERSLAVNYSTEVVIVSRAHLSPVFYNTNNTKVVHLSIVANDPADFTRNSYSQRTLNDLMALHGHSDDQIDLLRLVAVDRDVVQMWELVHFLNADGLLLRVQQLHLLLYIDKLDDDYLYNWYRTLYELFTKSGLALFHTASHDPLCLQVTLMQSCVYFLAYVRNPGPHVFTMFPPADFGTVDQEWRRLFDHLRLRQTVCTNPFPDNVMLLASNLRTSCLVADRNVHTASCKILQFRSTTLTVSKTTSVDDCLLVVVAPIVDDNVADVAIESYAVHIQRPNSLAGNVQTMAADETWLEVHSHSRLTVVEVNVPDVGWQILEQLLANRVLQMTSQLLLNVHVPSSKQVRPAVLRSMYSQLRRVESIGFRLFHSTGLVSSACSRTESSHSLGGSSSSSHVDYDHHPVEGSELCFQLGYVNSNLV